MLQPSDIANRNICANVGLETSRSKWDKPPNVVENDRGKVLRDFQTQTDKRDSEPAVIVVVDKHYKKAVVINVAVLNNKNIRKREEEKLEKYEGLRGQLERMQGVKTTVV